MTHTATTRTFSKKSRGQQILHQREHYLRKDLPCGSGLCVRGCAFSNPPRLNAASCTALLIPDAAIVRDFLDLFELPDLADIVFLQSVVAEVQREMTSKTFARLRSLIRDPLRHYMLFYNEYAIDTYVERSEKESIEYFNARVVKAAAQWYWEHLEGQVQVIILTKDEDLYNLQDTSGPPMAMALGRFLSLHPQSQALSDLYESLYMAAEERSTSMSGGGAQPKQQASHHHFYDEYLPVDVLEVEIASGILFRGVIHLSKRNRKDAYVHGSGIAWEGPPMCGRDVYIPGKRLRNRAIDGDLVAVRLLPPSKWTSPEDYTSLNEDEYYERSAEAEVDDFEEAAETMALGDAVDSMTIDEDSSKSGGGIPTGKIVGILQRNDRAYVVSLPLAETLSMGEEGQAPHRDESLKHEHLLCIPMDPRIPKIRVRTRQGARLANSRFVVRIDEWAANSMYPNGHYVRELGPIGDLDAETEALMVEKGISAPPYGTVALALLPSSDWTVPAEEIAARRDIRLSRRVMSIDPLGSQDIDDCLSIHELPNGNVELGVHIADVDYFVPKGGLLDNEARLRSTTLYLVDRRMDMLPSLLSERLISLRGGVDRLAVSVMAEMTRPPECKVVQSWFGRTVIRSSNEMHYQLAQDILDQRPVQLVRWVGGGAGGVGSAEMRGHDAQWLETVRKDLVLMREVARTLNRHRLRNGALELSSGEVRFKLDDSKQPVDVIIKQDQEVNRMVAELMIFANAAVAQRVYRSFPTCALLRHHPLPRSDAFAALIKCAVSLGLSIDTTSSSTLAASIAAAIDAIGPDDPDSATLLRSLVTRAMSEAQYFSTGALDSDEYFHYGLGLALYTHFTSPIRRYADMVVHRQLMACVTGGDKPIAPVPDSEQLQEMCDHMNERHRTSKDLQKDSCDLFLALYIGGKGEELTDAIIFSLNPQGFFVYIPRYQIKGPVRLRANGRCAIVESTDGSDVSCSLSLSDDQQSLTVTTTSHAQYVFHPLEHVLVRLSVEECRAHRPMFRIRLASAAVRKFSAAERKLMASQPFPSRDRVALTTSLVRGSGDSNTKESTKAAHIAAEGLSSLYTMLDDLRVTAYCSSDDVSLSSDSTDTCTVFPGPAKGGQSSVEGRRTFQMTKSGM